MSDMEPVLFDYEAIPEDKRPFVLQKTAETQWLLKRTAEDIVAIGKNLIAVKEKLPHGMFGKWVSIEFQMSHDRVNVFMNIARRLGDKLRGPRNLDLGVEILRELAAPSTPDPVIDGVQSGEIAPTLEDIRQAKLEARLAKEAETRAKADAIVAQQQLFADKQASQAEIDELTRQIEALKEEMSTLTTPEVQIREVEKEVTPKSVTNKLEALQKKLDRITGESRQHQEANKALQDRTKNLDNQLKIAIRDRITSENDERIRQEWRLIISETHSCMMRLLGGWPTSLDIRSFEADDWTRLDQLKSTLRRVLGECDHLRYGGDDMIVSALPLLDASKV